MKKKLFIIGLILLFLAGAAYARMTVVGIAGMVAGGACATQADTCDEAVGSDKTIGRYDGEQYRTAAITADADATLCKVCIKMWKVGTPSQDYTLELWTDDGGAANANLPDAYIADTAQTWTPSTKISATSQEDAETTPTCFDINWSVTSGTKYHLVIGRTTSGSTANDYIVVARRNDCTPDNPVAQSDETKATWTIHDGYYNLPYIFYKD